MAAFAAIGCSSESPAMKENDVDKCSFRSFRVVQDALSIAKQYAELNSPLSRESELIVNDQSVKTITGMTTRSMVDTLIYAVDFNDDKGYLLISASKTTEPILGIIENGSYKENPEENSEAFNLFVEKAKAFVDKSRIPSGETFSDNDTFEDFIMYFYVDTIKSMNCSGPRVIANWGQDWPENIYCPNKTAGCGPVAIGQALSYFKPELSIDLTFEGKPCDKMNVNWSDLSGHVKSLLTKNPPQDEKDKHVKRCLADLDTHHQLGMLIRQIGSWCECKYGVDGTSTLSSAYFGVGNKLLAEYHPTYIKGNECYEKLKNGGIALMQGVSGEGGHAWIADGVGELHYDIWTYYYYNPKTKEYKDCELKQEVSKYVHCNWGWCGYNNGYFLEGVFDTEHGINPNNYASTRYNFDVNVYGYWYK